MEIYIPKNSYYALFFVLIFSFIIYKVESNPQTRFKYSKFSDKNKYYKIKSKIGMIIIYFPSLFLFLIYILNSNIYFNKVNIYYILNVLHYLKRLIEVIFVHKYSGSIDFMTIFSISFMYFTNSILSSYLINMVPNYYYNKNMINIGIVLFFIGEYINGYHHYLLSKLRINNEKTYIKPIYGLFKYIYCPHYLGEIIARIGCCLFSQNLLCMIFETLTFVYLFTRANNTLIWYEDKFEKNKNIKRIIPFFY